MIERILGENLTLFIKSFSVSGFIGLSYILILEIAQAVLGYQTGTAHALVAFVFYVIGIFANYFLQKNVVFQSGESPLIGFFAYNLANALLVSMLSGLFFASDKMKLIFGDFIESASIAFALLIISPITFFIFKKLFNSQSD